MGFGYALRFSNVTSVIKAGRLSLSSVVGSYEHALEEAQQFAAALPAGSADCSGTSGRGRYVGRFMGFVAARPGVVMGGCRWIWYRAAWGGIAVRSQTSAVSAEALLHIRHRGTSTVVARLLPVGVPMRDHRLRADVPFMDRFNFMEIASKRVETNRRPAGQRWCTLQGSNLRPLPCEGSALPLS